MEKQVARAEGEIAALEARIHTRSTELGDPGLYQDFSRWNTLYQEQGEWKKELDILTNRWSELSTHLEELKQKAATVVP